MNDKRVVLQISPDRFKILSNALADVCEENEITPEEFVAFLVELKEIVLQGREVTYIRSGGAV